MGFKNVILACASVLVLALPARAQDMDTFQSYVQKLKASLVNLETGRAYLQSQSLESPATEKWLDYAKHTIQMSAYSIGQWILPGLSSEDARSRLRAACDYADSARGAWTTLNRLVGEEQARKPAWQSLYTKARADLYVSCDD